VFHRCRASSRVLRRFDMRVDAPVPGLPAVTQSVPGPLAPLGALIVRACNEAGQALRNRGLVAPPLAHASSLPCPPPPAPFTLRADSTISTA
jgi:hypothetical protein